MFVEIRWNCAARQRIQRSSLSANNPQPRATVSAAARQYRQRCIVIQHLDLRRVSAQRRHVDQLRRAGSDAVFRAAVCENCRQTALATPSGKQFVPAFTCHALHFLGYPGLAHRGYHWYQKIRFVITIHQRHDTSNPGIAEVTT